MKNKHILVMLLLFSATICSAQNIDSLLNAKLSPIERQVQTLKTDQRNSLSIISALQDSLSKQREVIAEQRVALSELRNSQESDRTAFNGQIANANSEIEKANTEIKANNDALDSRSLWAVISLVLLLGVIGVVVYFLRKGINKGTTSIDEVRKAQDALKEAQVKMQEESVKLDGQLLSILEAKPLVTSASAEPDHSLAKKVADEIVRIELNMSRMDSSVKGYKQLTKAVERIKDNFKANGYEIVDMLGKPYNEGMKVVANFVADETLPDGAQIITGITKPQINYNGQMIQSAQITVSQNI